MAAYRADHATLVPYLATMLGVLGSAYSTSGDDRMRHDYAMGKTIQADLDSESGFEAAGLRVSIQSMKRNAGKLDVVYRIQTTTNPRRWGVERSPIPVDFIFADRRGKTIKSGLVVRVEFCEDFEAGRTDKNDVLLSVVPPPEARYVSIKMGGDYVTRQVLIRDRNH
jgi:hypothetical protein